MPHCFRGKLKMIIVHVQSKRILIEKKLTHRTFGSRRKDAEREENIIHTNNAFAPLLLQEH